MVKAPVNKIIRSSVVDGPGNRAVIFLQGCNFRCVYCHNPETIKLCNSCGECVIVCPASALVFRNGEVVWAADKCVLCDDCVKVCKNYASPRVKLMSAPEVMNLVNPSLGYIRGLTVSGGECSLYPEFVSELIDEAAKAKLGVLLDTNGSYNFSANPGLLEHCEGVMLDIKAPEESWEAVTNSQNCDILNKAEYIAAKGMLYEVRTVISSSLFNPEPLVREVCKIIKKTGSKARYKLIRYRLYGVREPYRSRIAEPDNALMETLCGIVKEYGIPVIVS